MAGGVMFVGSEVVAAGFRLAGVATRVPEAGGEAEALRAALAEASLVFLDAGCAAGVPAPELGRALAAVRPLLLIVPDLHGRCPVPDIAARVRLRLGVEA